MRWLKKPVKHDLWKPPQTTVDKPSNAPETIPSPVITPVHPNQPKDDQCKVDQSCITDTNIADEPSGTVDQVKPMSVETALKSVETVLMETGEDVNKNDKTKATIVISNSEINEFETEGEIKDSASPANPSLPAPLAKPITLPPQLPQNKLLMEQPETVDETKRSQVTVETKSCTVRLEILTEANIVKHIHVH